MSIDRDIAHAARTFHGVVCQAELRRLRVDRKALQRRERAGQLTSVGRRTWVLAGAPPTPHQRCAVALSEAGPWSRLSHRTAAWLAEFDEFEFGTVEISVPFRRQLLIDDVIVHRTRDFSAKDRRYIHGLAVTSPERTILDLAGHASDRELKAAIDSAIRDHKMTAATLRARAFDLRKSGRAGIARALDVLDGRPAGGLHSPLERTAYDLVMQAGFDTVETQVSSANGSFRLDVVADGCHLEFNGHAHHSTRDAITKDAKRTRILTLERGGVLPFTGDEVAHDPEGVLRELITIRDCDAALAFREAQRASAARPATQTA
jgi:very-short-patch-repair endonuclease